MRIMPAEWELQSGVILAWPHEGTDWKDNILEAEVIVLSFQKDIVKKSLSDIMNENVILVELEYNDTWARDFGPISIKEDNKIKLLDFQFNGWGNKFNAGFDNQVNRNLNKSVFTKWL